MEKLVLVPYDKYQRMLKMKRDSSGEEQIQSAQVTKPKVMPLSPKSGNKKKRKGKTTVARPPPGKRDISTSKKTDKFMDWISF